eukprot:12171868-Prorocentrum_lima.AAC.1
MLVGACLGEASVVRRTSTKPRTTPGEDAVVRQRRPSRELQTSASQPLQGRAQTAGLSARRLVASIRRD